MGVFDGIDINDSLASGIVVLIQRANGIPLEAGQFDGDGVWVPSQIGLQSVGAEGFGLTAGGHPYFQVGGADDGERAELLVNPDDGSIWLEVP